MIFVVGWRPGCPSSLDVTQRVMPRLDGLLVAIQVPVEVVPTLHVVTSVARVAPPGGRRGRPAPPDSSPRGGRSDAPRGDKRGSSGSAGGRQDRGGRDGGYQGRPRRDDRGDRGAGGGYAGGGSRGAGGAGD